MVPTSSRTLAARLRARFSRSRLSKADFDVAIAAILAASPRGIRAADSLLFSQELRDLELEWRNSRMRLLHRRRAIRAGYCIGQGARRPG